MMLRRYHVARGAAPGPDGFVVPVPAGGAAVEVPNDEPVAEPMAVPDPMETDSAGALLGEQPDSKPGPRGSTPRPGAKKV